MADATLTKLLQLASEAGSGSLRHAALKVLGSVGTKDAKLVKMLLRRARDTEQDAASPRLSCSGSCRSRALPHLDTSFNTAAPSSKQRCIRPANSAARAKRVGKVMQEVSPSIKARINAVLVKANTTRTRGHRPWIARRGSQSVVDSTARSLAMEPGYQRRNGICLRNISSIRSAKNIVLNPEAALLRVLSALHEAKAEDLFAHPAAIFAMSRAGRKLQRLRRR